MSETSNRVEQQHSRRDRDRSVPAILESFPIPPTHIPSKLSTPTSQSPIIPFPNPPPSRPPSLPLPPVPGPSRISEHDTLLLLTSANSRRSSKYSTTSDTRRDSVASSNSSLSHTGGRSPSVASSSSRPTSRAIPRQKSPPAGSVPRPSIAFSISEESPDTVEYPSGEQLTRLDITMPFSDDDFDIPSSPPLLCSPTTTRSHRSPRHTHNDSISSIDMRDLLAVHDDPDPSTAHVPPFNAFRPLSRPQQPTGPSLPEKADNRAPVAATKLSITVPSRASHGSLADPIDPQFSAVHHSQLPDQDRSSLSSPPPTSGPSSTLDTDYLSSSSLPGASFEPSLNPPTLTASPPPTSPTSTTATSQSPQDEMDPSFKPQELHLELRAVRSKSISHKQALRARSRSKSPSKARTDIPHVAEPLPVLPSSLPSSSASASSSSSSPLPPTRPVVKKRSLPPSSFKEPERSSSPDIETMIMSTPRPLRCQSSSYFSEQGANSKSARSSFASVGSRSRKSSNVSSSSLKSRDMLDGDLQFVRGTWEGVIDNEGGGGQFELEGGAEEEESDSSLDLHTPLPHLMVRHGLLSPNSKLLPQVETRSITPHSVDGRPGSTLSMGSTVTKSGVIKDERDTPMRKERHRNGKLLRGGIGLTTGLGWSDSEDEDAPSPLTRRLSNLNMSRQTSMSSMRSASSYYPRTPTSAKHPLSRSFSGGTVYPDIVDESADEWGVRRKSMPKTTAMQPPPPTSWVGASGSSTRSRISTSSAGSTHSSSAAVYSTTSAPNLKQTTRSTSGGGPVDHNQNQHSDDTLNTPSTASSLSIPLPTTPQDDLVVSLNSLSTSGKLGRKGKVLAVDKDKSLPPLPLQPILKKQQSQSSSLSSSAAAAVARARTVSSSGASGLSTPISGLPTPSSGLPTLSSATAAAMKRVASPGPVRPLQLPQRIAGAGGDRPPVPVPLVSSSSPALLKPHSSLLLPPLSAPALTPSRSFSSLSSNNSALVSSGSSRFEGTVSMPTSPTGSGGGVLPKPKPRTGTGMAYRKSSYSTLSVGGGGVGAGVVGAGNSSSRTMTTVKAGAAPIPLATASLARHSTATRTRTPGPHTTTPTPIGQAF